jgi:hypothetical protein
MKNLATITNNLFLEQSELYGDLYEKMQYNELQTFNEVSINVLDDWYNSLLTQYNQLNPNQIKGLQFFITSLKYVLTNIDPNKLNIDNELIEGTDLLLWRESSDGISKLVFDEFGQIVYMFNGNNGRKIKGVFDLTIDMEKLLYKFISM